MPGTFCVCVCHRGMYTQSPSWFLLNYTTACKGQAATGLLSGPTSKDFSLKRAGRICTVPKKAFFGSSCLGMGNELGWLPGRAGMRQGGLLQHPRTQGSGKVSPGEMLLPPRGSLRSSKSICFLYRVLKLLSTLGRVVLGEHPHSPMSVGVS